MAVIHIFLGQMEILWRDPRGNLERLRTLLGSAKGSEDSLLVLPEMMSTGFTDDLQSVVEPEGGSWERDLHGIVDRHGFPTLFGVARQQESTITNEAVLFRPGAFQTHAAYRKIRPFRSENKVVSPGAELAFFEFCGARVCPLICYDLRFPELFRAGLRQGAEIFIVMASWPDPRHHHWELLLRARAVENQAYVVGVNRCGDDPMFHHAGGSMVVDPHGEVIYHAGDQESLGSVAIDVQAVREWRAEFPAVKDFLNDPKFA